MTDLPRFPVSRRTVLQGGVWAVPVIAAAVAAPSQTTSPPTGPVASATPDWFETFRALTIQSTEPGAPLPAGAYVFTTAGGVVPSADVFRTVPDLEANTIPATGQQTTATVTLARGSSLLSFTVYILTTALPPETNPAATLTVTLPTGGGATVTILEQPPVTEPTLVYGPNGGHWPSQTPAMSDAFVYDVEVACTWTAIAAGIAAAPASGNARVRVRPGTLPAGGGSGSSVTPIPLATTSASRTSKVLVVPRDGWGTVEGSLGSSSGYSFAMRNVALMGIDFSGQSVLLRSCVNAAAGWSTFAVLNVTANASDVSAIELVECVLPDSLPLDGDRMAFRIADGSSIDGLTMSGCYVAPAYKASNSDAHSDSLQISRSNGTSRVSNVTFVDTVFFQSSSQVLQFAITDGVTLRRTAVIGGLRGTGRYPISADRHTNEGENALWGAGDSASDVTMADCVILGSINSSWKFTSISNTVTSKALSSGTAVGQGGVTVDPQFASRTTPLPTAWFDANCPLPSPSRLASIWSALG